MRLGKAGEESGEYQPNKTSDQACQQERLVRTRTARAFGNADPGSRIQSPTSKVTTNKASLETLTKSRTEAVKLGAIQKLYRIGCGSLIWTLGRLCYQML